MIANSYFKDEGRSNSQKRCPRKVKMLWYNLREKEQKADFPCGPVVKISHSECRGHGCDPWLGGAGCCMQKNVAKKKKEQKGCIDTCDTYTEKCASQVALVVKNLPANAGDVREVRSLGGEAPLEEGMATHSSILAWRIPWTEESGDGYSPKGCTESDTTEVT